MTKSIYKTMRKIYHNAKYDRTEKRHRLSKKKIDKLQNKVQMFIIKNYQNSNLDDTVLRDLSYVTTIGLLEEIMTELKEVEKLYN